MLEEIERTVLTPEARRIALVAAEEWIERGVEQAGETATQLTESLARVSGEIENLLRAIELGAAPPSLLGRLQEREKDRTSLKRQLASVKVLRTTSPLDRHRARRILQEGLSRLADVLTSEPTLARQALGQILADKVRFTPVDLGGGARTYRFEANLSLGRLGAAVTQNDVGVPNGICTLLFPTLRLRVNVKRAA